MDLKNVLPLMRPAILFAICMLAVVVRLFAVQRFEAIIHEFDPYVVRIVCVDKAKKRHDTLCCGCGEERCV